ncbi:hypothetical protein IJG93_02345 [Candidatus Saccharibacteria bacterium]|nr:hypothetical protein [Candidatus Saccharibacteria bacterium]MBQ3436495.1 hypothetical protein [Candidatus Saccharibacteria bacterium]
MTTNLSNRKRVAKTTSLLVGGLAIASSIGFASVVSAWGPERTTYTNESPASYATFNSITDNVAVGDERNFVRVRELGTDETYKDEVEVTPGKEYEVYIYYHNNAGSNTNTSGYGVATDTRVSSAYPTILSTEERGMISGIISWSYVTPESPNNAKTGSVWDEAYLITATDGTVLRYKTGTATIHNDGKVNGSVLPTTLFTKEGTPIGFNKLTGVLPGCAEYSGYITYTLVAENIDSSLEKQVSLDGENWSDEVTAKPGDYVTYRVKFKNTGNTHLTNVIMKDAHDDGLTLRTGSTKVFDVDNEEGKEIDDIIDISGYNTGDAAPGALVRLIYQAQVNWDDKSICNKSLDNTISVAYNSEDQKSDKATVLVACEEEEEPGPTPEDCETNPNIQGCQEKNCKTNPEMEGCKELPNTGPLEIILAIVIIAGIGGAGYYFYRTKRTLKNVEKDVSGKDTPAEEKKEESKPEEAKPEEEAKPDTKE